MPSARMIDSASRKNDNSERSRSARDAARRRFLFVMGSLAMAMLALLIVLMLVLGNLVDVIYAGGL